MKEGVNDLFQKASRKKEMSVEGKHLKLHLWGALQITDEGTWKHMHQIWINYANHENEDTDVCTKASINVEIDGPKNSSMFTSSSTLEAGMIKLGSPHSYSFINTNL